MEYKEEFFKCAYFKPMDDNLCGGVYVKSFDVIVSGISGMETKIAKWYISKECLRCHHLSPKVRGSVYNDANC